MANTIRYWIALLNWQIASWRLIIKSPSYDPEAGQAWKNEEYLYWMRNPPPKQPKREDFGLRAQ